MISAQSLTAFRIVPVLVLDDVDGAAPVAEALRDGGLPLAEVTLRTPTARDCIRAMREVPGVIVGAGTVTRAEQVDDAVAAGASFIVSPGLSEPVVRRALALDVLVVPGVLTPSEVMRALDLGIGLLKFFPAEAGGGVRALSALAGPFDGVEFVPTGGVTAENMGSYLALPTVAAVGGSWLAPREMVTAGEFDAVREGARAAVERVRAGKR